MTASGVGRNASVTITKTRAYFDAVGKESKKYSQEYSKLMAALPAATQADADQVQQPGSSSTAATTGQRGNLKRPRSPSSVEAGPSVRPAPGQQGRASANDASQQPEREVIIID
ncbi:hypothetical protein HK102_010416 [Quaeritorhiza haematococci]|nr:hypothetical protein HK102_010416 [Quaeritorhiza haematococci]